tara:strand:+ start:1436 stop:2248 length:813 start_codon:yes stop_codon:yes gene_type:complete
MSNYFNKDRLYGDDFSLDEIERWYKEEIEEYQDINKENAKIYTYAYHVVNKIYGFNKLKNIESFENVLGFGSARGYEFEPIVEKIKKLTIIEPSDEFVTLNIGGLSPVYTKPNINGDISFQTDSFDLITCFGTLHHIPNVSHVLQELVRVLRPGGHMLIREPIVSMGDWRKHREGLTKNERGIPVWFFNKELNKYNVEIVSANYCFTAPSFVQRIVGRFLKKPIFSYLVYVIFDKLVSFILKGNTKYYREKIVDKVAPSSIFYVIKKNAA